MTDELKENAALFALGLLEEAEAFLQEAARDPELAFLTAEYQATLGVIALSSEPVEPPASLRESILAMSLGEDAPGEGTVPASAIVPFPHSVPTVPITKAAGLGKSILPWSLAACLAVGCAALAYRTASLQRENANLIASRDDWSSLRLAALAPAEPGASTASGRALWDKDRGVGVFESGTLPALSPTQVYQLWIFEKDNPAPVPAGFFVPSESLRAELKPLRPVGEVAAVAVSIEVAGGRPQPEGQVVLVGKLEISG